MSVGKEIRRERRSNVISENYGMDRDARAALDGDLARKGSTVPFAALLA